MPASLQLSRLPRPRLVLAAAVALLVLGAFGWLMLARPAAPDRILFGGLAPADMAPITQVLDGAGIAYRLSADGRSLTVAEDQLGRARMAVAAQGLPNAGPAGYELMDRGQSLGSTQFRDEITYLRALEGELGRSIGSLSGVRAAKVHIVMAKREPFSRDWTPPSASVLLNIAAPDILNREQVAAIRHLVAAAVPRLKLDDVSIVDNFGNLLATSDKDGGGDLERSDQRRVALEERIARAIEQQLSPIVGVGRVRAKVQAELDLSSGRSVEESYDPLAQVPRSVQTETDREHSREADPTVSVDNTLPENAGKPPANSGTQTERERSKQTTNFEIAHTTREHVLESGQIKRLSVSIAVDGVCEAASDGKTACRPRDAAELAQLERLARATSGFSADRGDTFEIASMPFAGIEPAAVEGGANGAAAGAAGATLPAWLPWAVAGGVALLALIGLLLLRRRAPLPASPPLLEAAAPALQTKGEAAIEAAPGIDGLLPQQGQQLVPQEPAESMVQLGRHVQGSVRKSTIVRAQAIIDANTEDAVASLRSWLLEPREIR